uniref:Uncharacterized protein n=1 Tax=Eptatretus burgeri TaxID=7764 RepID=A0A8C4X0Y8_EPTBU
MKFSQCLCALLVMGMMNVGGGEEANKSTYVWQCENCTAPLIPHNGGIICITVNKTRYCKPMCNKHYDFAFLRRSRPFEKCGPANDYEWTTQYIGGNRLAECIESHHTSFISGLKVDYFRDTCEKERHKSEMHINKLWRTVKKAVMKTPIEDENCVKNHCFNPYYHCGKEF